MFAGRRIGCAGIGINVRGGAFCKLAGSQAESVTSFVPHKFKPEVSSAVRMPSLSAPVRRFAFARANPERNRGFLDFQVQLPLSRLSINFNRDQAFCPLCPGRAVLKKEAVRGDVQYLRRNRLRHCI